MRPFILHNFALSVNLLIFRGAKFVAHILGARLLSSYAFGVFSYLFTLMDIWAHLFGLGIDVVASRSYRSTQTLLWQQAAWLKAGLSLLGVIAGFLFLPWPYGIFFGLWHWFFMQGRLAYSYANTLLYPKGIIWAGAVAEAALLGAAVIGIKTWGLLGFLGAFILERFLESFCLWAIVLWREKEMRRGWLHSFVSLLASGKRWDNQPFWQPLFLVGLCQLLGVLAARLDSLIVRWHLDYQALGYYSLAFRCAEAPLFLFVALADSSLAYFIRHPEQQKKVYRAAMRSAFFVGLLMAAGLSLFALTAAEFIFGSQYKGLGPLLAAYAWVVVLRGANMVSSSFLLASKQEKVLLASSLGGLIFSMACNAYLIPMAGLVVPVLSAVITEGIIYCWRAQVVTGRCLKQILVSLSLLMLAAWFIYSAGL